MTRPRMGEVLAGLGSAAKVNTKPEDPGKVAARKDHLDLVKQFSKGGDTKGQGAYGVAASVPPPPIAPPPMVDPEGTCAFCLKPIVALGAEDVVTTEIEGEPRAWCNEVCLAGWTANQ